ncbi:hypothetical protein SDC9_43644 [bioreactor metagenome]|uniref:Uncharacterized protein n=1 Tax=bioreactor metagenome TaxID=1076179 RepID=A0A644W4U0_9ZZZZ
MKFYINKIEKNFCVIYSHGYNREVKFSNMKINNLKGNISLKSIKNYKKDLVILKSNETKFLNKGKKKVYIIVGGICLAK